MAAHPPAGGSAVSRVAPRSPRVVPPPFLVAKPASLETIPGMSSPSIERLRHVGKIEGVSYLVLLFIAMPLKYFLDQPLAVKVVGWLHGVLFIWFCWVLAVARFHGGLSYGMSLLAFIAALLPFGPFVIDRRLQTKAGGKS
jgi:integral membrane protein